MAYAGVEDLEARWRPLDGAERARAAELLEDASAFLDAMLANAGVAVDPDDATMARNLRAVTCAIVHRAMGVADELYGVSQYSQTAGVFSQSGTAANPNGDMYLTAQEKALLGIPASGSRSRLHFARGAIHAPCGGEIDGW